MRRLLRQRALEIMSAAFIVLLAATPAHAQFRWWSDRCRQPCVEPAPSCMPSLGMPVPDTTEKKTPETAPTPMPETAPPELGPVAQALSPNMFGNFISFPNRIAFFINRTEMPTIISGTGLLAISNAKICENNNPMPEDRVGFRYNFYSNPITVTGISNTPHFSQELGTFIETPATRRFDVNAYTFDFEKTFFDGRASVQFRVPFANTLSSNLNLTYGVINPAAPTVGAPPGSDFATALNVIRTPEETLGSDATEFGNLQLLFKGLLYHSQSFALGTGLGLGFPTARDQNVRITDFLGTSGAAEIQRVREFHIENNAWTLSPYIGFVANPSERIFSLGFFQLQIPLNSNRATFSESLPVVRPGLTLNPDTVVVPPGGAIPPFSSETSLREQTLLYIDYGLGYWLTRNPESRWITGLAATVELHYATALNNADILTFRRDFAFQPTPRGTFVPATTPQVGNLANRFDNLDMTVGTIFEIGNRSTLGLAFAFPLRTGDNRFFQWEFQVQYNVLFGGQRSRAPLY